MRSRIGTGYICDLSLLLPLWRFLPVSYTNSLRILRLCHNRWTDTIQYHSRTQVKAAKLSLRTGKQNRQWVMGVPRRQPTLPSVGDVP